MAFRHVLRGNNAPFYIYKYGIQRIEPFFDRLQENRVRVFIKDFLDIRNEAKQEDVDEPPDIVAHSFGTLIIGRALELNKDIKFGKVILCGSILPPDFDWQGYISSKRVAAVLNHFGSNDFWARIAVRGIPHSGPSGRIGFIETGNKKDLLFNVRAEGYAHSDFFEKNKFNQHYNSIWQPFLWGKLHQLSKSLKLHDGVKEWKRPSFFLRAPFLTYISVSVIVTILALLVLFLRYIICNR
jgi:pimeloyl-ACP methyl ester carboxylesterase